MKAFFYKLYVKKNFAFRLANYQNECKALNKLWYRFLVLFKKLKIFTKIPRGFTKHLFNAKQLIVFGNSFRSAS